MSRRKRAEIDSADPVHTITRDEYYGLSEHVYSDDVGTCRVCGRRQYDTDGYPTHRRPAS